MIEDRPEQVPNAEVGDAHGSRSWLVLAVSAAAGATACVLSGGLAGPLGVLCLAPLVAALLASGGRFLAGGAILSVAAAALAALAALLGAAPSPPGGPLAMALGLLGLAVIALSLGVGLVLARRKQLEQADRLSVEGLRLARLLSGLPHLLIVLYPHGRVRSLHGRAPEGVDLDDLRQGGLVALSTDRSEMTGAIRMAIETGSAEIGFAPLAAQDRWLVASLRRTDEDMLLVMLRDSTTERAREASLDQARADAEALASGKSRFLANMSHELRTPLNAIMGFSDIMKSRLFGPMPDRYGEYGQLIHEAGSHLLDLINDVLDMSKIEADRFELSREAFDAREAISAALRLMRLQADGAGVQLRGLLPARALEIDADRRALKQIVLNLVSNALKFTPKGGAVTVTAQERDGAFDLVVADSGVGISREDLDRLGRPFEQAGNTERRALGTGLGLSLVRSFARLHGGDMEIESAMGEGTTVTVRLPVLLSTEGPEPAAAATDNVVAFTPQR